MNWMSCCCGHFEWLIWPLEDFFRRSFEVFSSTIPCLAFLFLVWHSAYLYRYQLLSPLPFFYHLPSKLFCPNLVAYFLLKLFSCFLPFLYNFAVTKPSEINSPKISLHHRLHTFSTASLFEFVFHSLLFQPHPTNHLCQTFIHSYHIIFNACKAFC